MKAENSVNPYFVASVLLVILFAMTQVFSPLENRSEVAREPAHIQAKMEAHASERSDYFFLPPETQMPVSDVTEQDYIQIIQRFMGFATADIYAQYRKPLLIPNEWESPFFAGYAKLDEKYAQISLWGGLVRAPGSTRGALVAILCHELGHLLGGEPRQRIAGADWASLEGQSDFFAAKTCMPRFFKAYPQFSLNISEKVVKKCGDDLICQKTLQAGLEMMNLLQRYSFKEYTPVDLQTLAPATEELITSYPSEQCRLDTYVHGARCHDKDCLPPPCWFAQ